MDNDIFRNIRVASPCKASWARMKGDERTRHCTLCNLNVYNFESMSRAEIIDLLERSEGRVCGRLFKRPDGTITTADCPVGRGTVQRKRLAWVGAGLMLAAMSFATTFTLGRKSDESAWPSGNPIIEKARNVPVIGSVVDKLFPAPRVLMGVIAPIAPPSSGGPSHP